MIRHMCHNISSVSMFYIRSRVKCSEESGSKISKHFGEGIEHMYINYHSRGDVDEQKKVRSV